jgi:hypothetical protein
MREFVLDTELPVMPMGFDVPLIESGATHLLAVQPQRPFRVIGIFIPRSIAVHFDISDFRIGMTSYFVSSCPISAELYAWSCGHEDCEGHERNVDGELVEKDPAQALKLMEKCIEKHPDQPRIVRKLQCDTAMPGIMIMLQVINKSIVARRFQGVFLGNVPEPEIRFQSRSGKRFAGNSSGPVIVGARRAESYEGPGIRVEDIEGATFRYPFIVSPSPGTRFGRGGDE